MKVKFLISMIVMAFVAVAGLNVMVVEAASPASVVNNSGCKFNITIYTDAGTQFGPASVGPNSSYDIKVPTGETIARIVINGQSNDPNIAVGTCAALNAGPALCVSTPPTRFCRRDTQIWVIM